MQIKELAARLQSLGLSDKEARVYVAALFLGPAPVQKIAEQADINRATAYVILDQLADLGLISQSQDGKKTVFVAEGPEALNRLFDRQAEAVEGRRKELKSLVPELEHIGRTESRDAPVVRFYKGKEGVNTVTDYLRRKARPKSTIYGFINYDEVERIYPEILKTARPSRLKKDIASKVIYSYRDKDVPSDPSIKRETAKVATALKADMTIYENAVYFATYDEDVSGVLIESPEIVGAIRQLFEMAWKDASATPDKKRQR